MSVNHIFRSVPRSITSFFFCFLNLHLCNHQILLLDAARDAEAMGSNTHNPPACVTGIDTLIFEWARDIEE